MQRIKDILKSDKPVKWLFYGDSITHGALHTSGWRDYAELFTERVRFELGRPMDIVLNNAISGNNTVTLLDSFDWRVGQFEPDVVLLMIGMNDCSNNKVPIEKFESNLGQLVERIEAFNGTVVMQTTCPILPKTSPDREPHLPAYMEVIRRVAGERNLPLIDHTAHWEAHPDKFYYWMSNPFHPNEYGHRAFANLIFKEFGIWNSTSVTCRLFVP
ncbi:MAG: SGNH/GDSL hydrolase family protein [Planctomycetota bacterium]|nr:SGNH/GDSL hydrolase family protein [Planctomycetota bacterium]MDA1140568.1 SGNH/GDSL hydrolase family protein [Planctomycetota bacterium]